MKFEDLKKCLKENELMKNQNVIDICMSFSSRHNDLKYKIEGNSAIYEDRTIIKFILNDDNEIEYYIINNQGDMSNVYPIYDYKLLDLTESDIDDIDWSQHPEKDKPFIEQGKCPYCTGPITKEEYKLYGMCSTCWDSNVE